MSKIKALYEKTSQQTTNFEPSFLKELKTIEEIKKINEGMIIKNTTLGKPVFVFSKSGKLTITYLYIGDDKYLDSKSNLFNIINDL